MWSKQRLIVGHLNCCGSNLILKIKARGWQRDILVDQGAVYQLLKEQLTPELIEQACTAADVSLTFRRQEAYGHFIGSFVGYHPKRHTEQLAA